jgi:hypothetical protein
MRCTRNEIYPDGQIIPDNMLGYGKGTKNNYDDANNRQFSGLM